MTRPMTAVRLRAFVPADEPAVSALFAEPAVRQWNPGPAVLDVAAWCTDNNRGAEGSSFRTWAIADPDDDRFLGTVSVFGLGAGDPEAQIGYRVRAAETGRGVATAAVVAACRRALTELAPTSIRLHHAVANPASCRVALRSGFALVATEAGTEPYGDGELHDEHLHRLVDLGGLRDG